MVTTTVANSNKQILIAVSSITKGVSQSYWHDHIRSIHLLGRKLGREFSGSAWADDPIELVLLTMWSGSHVALWPPLLSDPLHWLNLICINLQIHLLNWLLIFGSTWAEKVISFYWFTNSIISWLKYFCRYISPGRSFGNMRTVLHKKCNSWLVDVILEIDHRLLLHFRREHFGADDFPFGVFRNSFLPRKCSKCAQFAQLALTHERKHKSDWWIIRSCLSTWHI